MRRPTLKRWLERELKYVSGQTYFNYKQLVRQAETTNARLLEPLVLYALHTGRVEELLSTAAKEDTVNAYFACAKLFGSQGIEQCAIEEQYPTGLDRVYQKHLHSFSIDWHKAENTQAKKLLLKDSVNTIVQSCNLSLALGIAELGLDSSNTYAFLAGRNDALSYEKASTLATWARNQRKTMLVSMAESELGDSCIEAHKESFAL